MDPHLFHLSCPCRFSSVLSSRRNESMIFDSGTFHSSLSLSRPLCKPSERITAIQLMMKVKPIFYMREQRSYISSAGWWLRWLIESMRMGIWTEEIAQWVRNWSRSFPSHWLDPEIVPCLSFPHFCCYEFVVLWSCDSGCRYLETAIRGETGFMISGS